MSNRELTYAQRQEFAARSALHARFDLFVQAIVRVAAGKVHRLGGISKEALCAGLKLLFDEADLDNNKSIDVDELRSLLVELPRRYNANPDDIPTSSDADLVMSALDADGDGHVDYEEWEEWVVSNRTMTEADISSFASISPTHGRLNRFVESIVKIASDKMRRLGGDQLLRGLRMMFEEFDTNENGAIDMDELRAMMTAIPYVYTLDVKNAPKPDADSAAVMAALDRDGNGSIDFAEFRDWILAYRDMSSERQKDFAARSQQHARLNWFACAIVTISLDEAGHEKKVEPFAEDHTFSAANLPTQDGYEYDYDDEMEAASEKIQAVQRGRRVRREQEERRRATLKIQALHRGRRARQQNRIIGTQKAQDLFSAPSFDQQNKETFCAGLRLVFSEADLDRSDSIDLDELQTLMLELPHRYNVDPGTIPLPQDTGVVMSALDADGNGRVDFSEWQDWVLSNRALSPEDRALLTARSEVHNRLDKFVETISMIASLKMSRLGGDVLISGLNVVFKEFDTDGDGILDMDELRALVIAIPAMYQDDNEHAPLPRDVGRIMDALDRDASGGVDYAEFRDWILTNLDLNDVERENLTARSEELKRLDWFARAIASIAREMAPEHEEATEDEKLSGEYTRLDSR
jgi:Ca2+-binding EF-hand superfamily protein